MLTIQDLNLDWTVSKKEMFYAYNEENKKADHLAIIRDDNGRFLTSVSEQYHPFQNKDLYNFIEQFSTIHSLKIEKGGYLNNGKKIYLQVRLSEDAKIGKDTLKNYFFVLNSHDKTSSLRFGFTNTVISCQNTFNKAIKDASFSFSHSIGNANAFHRMENVYNKFLVNQKETIVTFEKMVDIDYDALKVEGLLETLIIPNSNEISTRVDNIIKDVKFAISKESMEKGKNLWGLFNGITYYANHMKTAINRPYGKEESILIGSANTLMNKAYELLTDDIR